MSDLIPKDIFENELARACHDFISFCEKTKIPVNQEELSDLRKSYEQFISKK